VSQLGFKEEYKVAARAKYSSVPVISLNWNMEAGNQRALVAELSVDFSLESYCIEYVLGNVVSVRVISHINNSYVVIAHPPVAAESPDLLGRIYLKREIIYL